MPKIDNVRIENFTKLISPNEIRSQVPVSDKATNTIDKGREDFCNILDDKNDRFVVIAGPCSIHDTKAAMEYAKKLMSLKNKFDDKLLIMMRVYFEKPRTTTGWKGLISDPYLNNTQDMRSGLTIARKLLIDIAELGMPTATELLDPITAAYIAELVSWAAIGARTTESQTHRQMASGLSAPVGFKNNTDGNLDVAINAVASAKSSHSFLGIDDDGNCSIIKTTGNSSAHIILRGGKKGPNYHVEDVEKCESKLKEKKSAPKIMVDLSHANSGKKYERQKMVLDDIIAQKKVDPSTVALGRDGNKSIFGVMIESNLFEGNQKITNGINDLKYGVSVTDACIGWDETEKMLNNLYKDL